MLIRRLTTQLVFVCLAIVSWTSIAAPPKALENISIQLKWAHAFQFAGYYAALYKGFYADEGLNVTIVARAPALNVTEQVLTGRVNYGVSDSGLIEQRLNGEPVVLLATIFQHSPLVYVSLKNSGIVSPYEMKGKRIMDDSIERAPLLAMLYDAGIFAKEVEQIDHTLDIDDLLNNKVDVLGIYLTDEIQFFKQKGIDINIIDPRNYGIDFTGDNLFTSEQEILKHPDRPQRFTRASLKGWDYALKHPEEIIQVILDRYNSDHHLTKAHLRFEAQQTQKMILPDSIPLGYVDTKRFSRIAETYKNLGLVDSTNKLDNFVYGQSNHQDKLDLSAEEISWLKSHSVIKVGIDPEFAPFEWIDDKGNYVGLSADYLKQIEQRLGVKFEIMKNKTWADILEMAQHGDLDMLTDANQTPERDKFLYFTNPYIDIPIIIIDNGENGFIGSLARLEGKKVAVEQSYFMQELLYKNHPNIQQLPVKSVKDALFLVSNKTADAYIGDAACANYAIKKEGLLNLGVAGETKYRSWHRMAVAKKNPELLSILNKAFANIPKSEKDAIENRWLSLTVEPGIKLQSILQFGGLGLLLFTVSIIWNFRLRREMRYRKKIERQLRKKQNELVVSQEQLSFALIGANDGLWDWNLETDETYYSSGWKNMLGYTEDELSNSLDTWIKLSHPEDCNHAFQEAINYISGNICKFEVEFRMQHKQGHWLHILSRARLAIDNNGNLVRPKRLIGTHMDITERKKAEEELRKSASVFANTQDGIVITDINSNIIDINQAFTKITGYSRDEVMGKNPRFLQSGHHDEHFYAKVWKAIKDQGFWVGEIWNRKKNGEIYVEWLTISLVKDDKDQPKHYIGTFTDITLLKEHEHQLKQIAHFDPLTGVPNRVLLADLMQIAVAKTKHDGCMMVVAYLDLDGFKPINDRFGHEAGDQVLIEITRRIKEALRDDDTLARLGGDEFVFLLLNLSRFEECETIIHRLLEIIHVPIEIQNNLISVSASIGITIFPEDDTVPDTLLRHADQAMYQAKQEGKNCYCIYNHALDFKQHLKRTAIARIDQGIENNEFVLFFQPKIDMRNGEVFGAEALIRWQHPERDLVMPIEFMLALENHELATKLDKWVVDSALKQMDSWCTQGWRLQISINISAKSLQAVNFVKELTEALNRYPQVRPEDFELEILETEALNDMALTAQIISDCQKLGVQFALDDFGTGYSSLSYLKHLPAQTLKIDRSFVRDMLEDEEDLAIVKGVIGFADSFKRKVIAEGVESYAHGQALLSMGCLYAQGYGIAKPMPSKKLVPWIKSWRASNEWKK
jgi:diguanylate cyclase (GGDEF)-like protein/PAS domain S-box-containing protein